MEPQNYIIPDHLHGICLNSIVNIVNYDGNYTAASEMRCTCVSPEKMVNFNSILYIIPECANHDLKKTLKKE